MYDGSFPNHFVSRIKANFKDTPPCLTNKNKMSSTCVNGPLFKLHRQFIILSAKVVVGESVIARTLNIVLHVLNEADLNRQNGL